MVGGEGDDVLRKLIELRYGDQFEQDARYTVEHAEDFLFTLRPDLTELDEHLDEHLGEWLQARDAGLWTHSDRELWEDLQAEIERFRGRWAATKRGAESQGRSARSTARFISASRASVGRVWNTTSAPPANRTR